MNDMPEAGPAATGLEDKAPGPAPPRAPERPGGQAPADAAAPASPRQRGRRLLIILFVISLVVAVTAAAVTGALLLHRSHWPPAAAHPLRATVFGLHTGQCFNSLPNGIAGAHAIPCAQPHDGEIYGTFRVAGRDWPGSAALGSQARLGCQARLTGYLNPQLDTSGLAESYAYPNQGAWAAGEHMVICEIRGTQGRLTGSVRASRP
jgi:Septum formation